MKKATVGLLLFICSIAAWAQSDKASITGSVKDTSGAVISGVVVVAENVATSAIHRTVTDASGNYRLVDLAPAVYRITYSRDGFKSFTQESVKLDVGQVLELAPSLTVGATSEKVVVTTAPAALDTASATIGDVVPARSIEGLPLNVRDSFALVTLTAGVQLGGNFGNGGGTDVGRGFYRDDFNVGGGRSGTQEILIDGAPNTTADGLNVIDPPVDAVQEFKVQANTYDAQFGRTSGGIVNMITKSGTNDFHGTLYEFERHSVLDANTFFNKQSGVKLPSFARHQFGATIGGPILRNKVFFFGDYEGLRQGYPNTAISTVPTPAERTGDFSQLVTSSGSQIKIYDPLSSTSQRSQFSGNVIPAGRIDPVAAAVMALYPMPNRASSATNQNNYIFSSKSTTSSDKYDIRGDYSYSEATKFFARLGRQKDTRLSTGNLPLPIGGGRSVQDAFTLAVLNMTHVFSQTILADVETSFGRSWGAQVGRSDGFDLSTIKLPSAYTSLVAHQFPVFNIGDITGTSNGSDAIVSKQPRNDYATTVNLYIQRGRHSLKFGADFRNIYFNEGQNSTPAGNFAFNRGYTQGPTPTQSSSTSGFGLASFLLGAPASGSVNVVNRISTHGTYLAGYGQDDWRATDRLTINMGLRWDLSLGDSEKYNRLAYFDPTSTSPLAAQANIPNLPGTLAWVGHGNPSNQQATNWKNFGPRVGVDYKLTEKTVVRGGYGIYFLPRHISGNGAGAVEAVRTTTMVASLDNGVTPYNYLSNPFPQGLLPALNDRNPLANIGTSLSAPVHAFRDSYSQSWSFGIQRELPRGFVVDVHYWGNKITHLPQSYNIDQLPDQYLSLGTALNQQVPNPFYGYISSGALSVKTISRQQSLLPYPQYTGITQVYGPQAASTYNAGTIQVDKRLSTTLTLLANYTWSKALDNARTPLDNYHREWEKSYSSFSIPHMAHVSAVYAIPYGRSREFGKSSNWLTNAVIGNWDVSTIVSLQSGLPVGVNRPAVMAAGDPKLGHPTIQKWFNTGLFTVAPAYTYGNVGPYLRDVRTEGMHNVDAVLSKNFDAHLFERTITTTFRFETYNLFNSTQFGFPNTNPTSQSFGQVTSTLNSPRDLQFALKIRF